MYVKLVCQFNLHILFISLTLPRDVRRATQNEAVALVAL